MNQTEVVNGRTGDVDWDCAVISIFSSSCEKYNSSRFVRKANFAKARIFCFKKVKNDHC